MVLFVFILFENMLQTFGKLIFGGIEYSLFYAYCILKILYVLKCENHFSDNCSHNMSKLKMFCISKWGITLRNKTRVSKSIRKMKVEIAVELPSIE